MTPLQTSLSLKAEEKCLPFSRLVVFGVKAAQQQTAELMEALPKSGDWYEGVGQDTDRRLKETPPQFHSAVLTAAHLCLAACARGREELLSLARSARVRGCRAWGWDKVCHPLGLAAAWPGEDVGWETGEPLQLMGAGFEAVVQQLEGKIFQDSHEGGRMRGAFLQSRDLKGSKGHRRK